MGNFIAPVWHIAVGLRSIFLSVGMLVLVGVVLLAGVFIIRLRRPPRHF